MRPMISRDAHESHRTGQSVEKRKEYVAPACKTLTPDEAKEWLMVRADPSDPEIKDMLEWIEALRANRTAI